MRCPALRNELQCLVKLGLRIMGQGQHDVAADVGKACPPCRRKSCPGLPGGVGAAQRFQLAVPGRLYPERDAVHPGFPETAQGLLGHSLRVGLQRDLRPGCRSCRRNEPGGIGRGEQAGGAAAKIDRVRVKRRFRRKAGKLPQKGIHILGGHAALAGGRIEITVPAFGKAVGNMQIKSKRHTISQPFSRNVHFYAVYYKT